MSINWSFMLGIALWALIPGFIARKKGRSFIGYFFLSFLISPLITIIVTLCLKNLNKQYSDNANAANRESTDLQEKIETANVVVRWFIS